MGMNPVDLYNMEPGQFENKYKGYQEQRKENQLHQAYFSFKIAMHMRSKDGFSFEDFTEVLPWYEGMKKSDMESQLEWRDEQVRLYNEQNN